jgi:hypothetical protein
MIEWLRRSYEEQVRYRGVEGRFLATLAYLATFLVARGYTSIAKLSGGGSHFQLGTTHIHHMVPGAAIELLGGVMALDASPKRSLGIPREALPGTVFGIGSALVVDEFSLILFVEDTYWQERGVNASLVAYAVGAGMLVTNLRLGWPLYRDTGKAIAEKATTTIAARLAPDG